MKKYRGKTKAKVIAFLACLLFGTVGICGGILTAVCTEVGYYQSKSATEILNRFYEKTYATNALRAFRAGEKGNYNIDEFTNYEFAILEGSNLPVKELKNKSNYVASNFSAGFPENYSVDEYKIGDNTEYNIDDSYWGGSYYHNGSVKTEVAVDELIFEEETQNVYARVKDKYYDVEYVYADHGDGMYIIGGQPFDKNDFTVYDNFYGEAFYDDITPITVTEDLEVTISVPKEDPTAKTYTVVSSVAKNLKPGGTDCIYEAYETYRLSKIASVLGPICFGVGGVIAIVCFVILMCLSGYHTEEVESRYEVYRAKKVEDGLYLQRRGLDKIPMDVNLIFVAMTIESAVVAAAVSVLSEASWEFLTMIAIATGCFVLAFVFVALLYCMTVAANFKCPKWWKNILVIMVITGIRDWLRKVKETSYETGKHLQMKTRIWTVFGLITAGEFFGLFAFASEADGFGVLFFFWFVEKVVFGVVLFKLLNQFAEIKKVTKEIKEGNLNASVATGKMFLDLREEGDAINSIGRGLDNAIEERLKSERFQTELITNVSHDIKTPLTSIINYVDLLKKEKPEGAKVKEYLDVLDRQSQRLKKLLQDLLDASKASTGNVELHMEKVDVDVLLNQTIGEFEEKLKAKGIDLKIKTPSGAPQIMADSRYLWRVFDNLMNNICKYGQETTRAYINLEVRDAKVKISFLNTSKEELNITGEELMQRFVRGDSSRNTEGSGLGLSIAKSLTELMKGTMDLSVDGDLFKVVLTFDAC